MSKLIYKSVINLSNKIFKTLLKQKKVLNSFRLTIQVFVQNIFLKDACTESLSHLVVYGVDIISFLCSFCSCALLFKVFYDKNSLLVLLTHNKLGLFYKTEL